MRLLGIAFVFGAACAHAPVVLPTVPAGEVHRVEERPMPPDIAATPAASDQGWAEPLEAGQCTSKPGILLSEQKVSRCLLYKNGYVEMRLMYEGDRKVWVAQRKLYETRLQLADQALLDAQPTWFQRNAFALGMVGGVILGVVGLVSAAQVAK